MRNYALIMLLSSSPALAQVSDQELKSAMELCSEHITPSSSQPWHKGWEKCADIKAAWLKTKDAREAREKAEAGESGKQKINSLSDKLPK